MSILNYRLIRGKWDSSITSLSAICAVVHKFGIESEEFKVFYYVCRNFMTNKCSFDNKYIFAPSIDYNQYLKYEEYADSVFRYLNDCCKYRFGGREYKFSYKNGNGYITLM